MIRYITRLALTTGIRVVNGTYTDCGKYFRTKDGRIFVYAKEAFATEEAAVLDARKKARAKATSLRKQIARLESPDWAPKIVSVKQ